jgi:hypothetical protein
MLLPLVTPGQMYLNDHTQRFLSAAHDAGYTMRSKDYYALIRFSEKVFQTGVTTGFDTTGATMVYNYTESGSTMTALYPVIGNTLTAQALNLVAAGTATTSPTFYGTFVGSPTPGDGQVPWNGSTQYFRSNVPLSTFSAYTTISMSYYSYTANAAQGMLDMGTNVAPTLAIFLRFTGNITYGLTKETGLAGNIPCSTSLGFRLINRTKLDSTQFYNNMEYLGAKLATRSSAAFSSFPLIIGGGSSNNLTVNLFSNRTWAGSHVGSGLSYAQAFSLGAAFVDLKYRK